MATGTFKVAKASPRIENGGLKWYNGDSFTIDWSIQLVRDDEPVIYDPNDHLVFEFYTAGTKPTLVYKFDFTNIQNDAVTLDFTPEITKLFPTGSYTFCGKYVDKDGWTVTIYANERVEVQACH